MRRLMLTVIAGLLVSTPVLAQTASPPVFTPRAAPPPPRLFTPNNNNTLNGIVGDIHRQNLTDSARQAVENSSPARRDRAERATVLINAGDCEGAHALALQERDRRLASRIAEICESPN